MSLEPVHRDLLLLLLLSSISHVHFPSCWVTSLETRNPVLQSEMLQHPSLARSRDAARLSGQSF